MTARARVPAVVVLLAALIATTAPSASATGVADCASGTAPACVEYCVIGVYDGGPTYPCGVSVSGDASPLDCQTRGSMRACIEYCPINPGGGGGFYPCGVQPDPSALVDALVATVAGTVEAVRETVEDAQAPKSTVGGGVAAGEVRFAWPGVPKAGEPCAATSFTLSGSSEAFALNTVITGYAGPVTLAGSGASSCEGASGGNGTLNLSASGTGPTGSTVKCTNLTGAYSRTGTDVQAQLGGSCDVNNYVAPVTFVFRGEFAPADGGGATAPIRAARFAGPFVVVPA